MLLPTPITFLAVKCTLLSFFSSSAELGDYDPEVHNPYFISEFRFVPDQTEAFELEAIEAFKQCRLV